MDRVEEEDPEENENNSQSTQFKKTQQRINFREF
jgi:hypothetical protein